jgi:hypothetical protein
MLSALLTVLSAAPRPGWTVGACCLQNDTCGDIAAADCARENGHWWGEGTNCDQIGSCQLGLCCQRGKPSSPGGVCDDFTTHDECQALCGFWSQDTQCYNYINGRSCNSLFVNHPLASDCNGDGVTMVNELIQAVQIALSGCTGECCVNYVQQGNQLICTQWSYVPACPAADLNHDGHVDISEIISGVRAALGEAYPNCSLN